MKAVDVLIVVDTLGALAGSLENNVYLVDTNKYVGSGNEGQVELKTTCKDGQLIKWRVIAISPSNDVNITGFTGQIISDKVCVPQKQGLEGDIYWEGRVETQGITGNYQYSVVLSIDGKSATFDPYLVIGV